jgi:hypothetical protein
MSTSKRYVKSNAAADYFAIGEENDFGGVVDLVKTKLLFGMKKVYNL